MDAPLLTVTGLNFAYPCGRRVLDNASLSVREGERLGLTGLNGTGKTTFFRVVTGLEKAQGGAIAFEGAPVVTEEDFRALRLKAGLLLQNSDDQLFFPEVLDDVAFGPLNQGLSCAEAEARARAALAELGIAHLAQAASFSLSGGQKKLVALASLTAMRPRLLMLDEPGAGLDAPALARLTALMRGLACTLIVVSHYEALLAAVCTRVVRLEGGVFKPA
ncbi:MAG: ABC transporter ATP-binding protein [Duodenibacillus sp.]|nr:ABC transporter ATP-binding protein [Duodenibacillus sp.]